MLRPGSSKTIALKSHGWSLTRSGDNQSTEDKHKKKMGYATNGKLPVAEDCELINECNCLIHSKRKPWGEIKDVPGWWVD